MIGIIAILLAILVPTLSKARASAQLVRCAATLRELAAASTLHHNLERRYPQQTPMAAVGAIMPASLQLPLLNTILGALKKPPLVATDSIDAFPHPLVCPVRNERDVQRAPDASFGTPFWQTGYMYLAGLEQQPNTGQVLAERHIKSRGTRRGVIWADTVTAQEVGGTLVGFGFYHVRGRWNWDPQTKVSRDASGFAGQHRAFGDGSVQWTAGRTLDAAALPTQAAYKISIGGVYTVYYLY